MTTLPTTTDTITTESTKRTPTEVLEALRTQRDIGALQLEIHQQQQTLKANQVTPTGLSVRELTELSVQSNAMEDAAWAPQYVDILGILRPEAGYGQFGIGVYPSTRSDRQDGRNRPIFQTETECNIIRGMARLLTDANETASGILEKLADYTLGPKGFDFKIGAKPNTPSDTQQYVSKAQTITDDFLELNRFNNETDRELFKRGERDGEAYLTLWHQEKAVVQARIAEPEQNTEPGNPRQLEEWLEYDNPSSWSFGIHTDNDDVVGQHGYYFQWSSADTEWDYIPGGRSPLIPHGPAASTWCEHIKWYTDSTVKRGLSAFYNTQRSIELAAKLLSNPAQTGTVQSCIAWIEQNPPGMTKDGTTQQNAMLSDGPVQRARIGGGVSSMETNRYSAGTILRPNAGRTYEAGPGAEFAESYLLLRDACLRSVASRWSFPEHMITGDASNNNFASILVAGDPFVKRIESKQGAYVAYFTRMIWKVLEFAHTAGIFGDIPWKMLRGLLVVTVTPPDVEVRDRMQETQRKKILSDAHVLSLKKWTAEENYDYDQMQKEISEQPQPQLPGMEGLGGTGGPDDGGNNGPSGDQLLDSPAGSPNGPQQGPNGQQPQPTPQSQGTSNGAPAAGSSRPSTGLHGLAREAVDALEAGNTHHKGKGEGGGQFTGSGAGSGGGPSSSSQPAPTGKTALPKNHKKLTIAQATTALAAKGIHQGKGHFDLDTKVQSYLLTFPDGKKEWVEANKIKQMVGYDTKIKKTSSKSGSPLAQGDSFHLDDNYSATVHSVDSPSDSIGGEKGTTIYYQSKKGGSAVGQAIVSKQEDGSYVLGVNEIEDNHRGNGLGRKLIPQLANKLGTRIYSDAHNTAAAKKMWEGIGAQKKGNTYFIDPSPRVHEELDEDNNDDLHQALESLRSIVALEDTTDTLENARKITDTDPTESQKASGNYRKGKFKWNGLTIAIENPKNSIRSGTDKGGKPWSIAMPMDYGYILKTTSEADGDHIDVFVGPDLDSDFIFIVDQLNQTDEFDEHKVLIGFDHWDDARRAYLSAYAPGWQGFGAVTAMTLPDFKDWLFSGMTGIPVIKYQQKLADDEDPEDAEEEFEETKHPRGKGGKWAPVAKSPRGVTEVDRAIQTYGPVLASSTQEGYTLRIHDSHPGSTGSPAHISDSNRSFEGAGKQTVQHPNGELVCTAGWMDWAEEHYPSNYMELPKEQRAQLEVEEQKKYGYKRAFDSRSKSAQESLALEGNSHHKGRGPGGGQFSSGGGSGGQGSEPALTTVKKSKATVITAGLDEYAVDEAIKNYLGYNATREDLASVVGAPDDAVVSIDGFNFAETEGEGEGILVTVAHPAIQLCERIITKDPSGIPYIINSVFKLHKDLQSLGLGTEIFATQVSNAMELGFDHIQCHAADGEWNGYYTWPRLGYDCPLDQLMSDTPTMAQHRLKGLMDQFPLAESVQDIFDSEGGPEAWKQAKLDIYEAKFDLAKDSRSSKKLAAYVQRKKEMASAKPTAQV